MIQELSDFLRRTFTYMYMTSSDGGLDLEGSFLSVAGGVPDHVEIVSTDTLSIIALAAKEYSSGFSLRGLFCNLSFGQLKLLTSLIYGRNL
jgi:hypothetical protein